MHLYSILRGKPSLVRRYKEDWLDVLLPISDGKGNKGFVQVVPRKVELVEWVFPRASLPRVIKTMIPHWQEKKPKDYIGKEFLKTGIAKMLGCKRIPNLNLKDIQPLKARGEDTIFHPYVANHLIGIREDKKNKDGAELL